VGGGWGWNSKIKVTGNARHLALWCKSQIFVSLKVFWDGKSLYLPIQVSLTVLCIKKFTKIALTLTTQKSRLGFSLSLSHTHIGVH